ncbi:photosystem II assembly protein Psb34 [Cylindrospermum sp. FACHB-282]|uniref:photosystem II assembly protein Psb34 n=1 Tax=Cylindrospermum sp. FACHB-282 TaxID=2692794 RepID=UPI00168A3F5C|nr:ssl1498 family light-harvesting-like protein [Cylindrospermum sp. FACHB-282]MBD2383899.1 ssl1498 family light-harvesting-like protein [Cylindrospermum sp. FACHB-282]
MYTTINENGILNNYANEPKMYYATFPSQEQQIRYALGGAVAGLFVTAIILVALGVS